MDRGASERRSCAGWQHDRPRRACRHDGVLLSPATRGVTSAIARSIPRLSRPAGRRLPQQSGQRRARPARGARRRRVERRPLSSARAGGRTRLRTGAARRGPWRVGARLSMRFEVCPPPSAAMSGSVAPPRSTMSASVAAESHPTSSARDAPRLGRGWGATRRASSSRSGPRLDAPRVQPTAPSAPRVPPPSPSARAPPTDETATRTGRTRKATRERREPRGAHRASSPRRRPPPLGDEGQQRRRSRDLDPLRATPRPARTPSRVRPRPVRRRLRTPRRGRGRSASP